MKKNKANGLAATIARPPLRKLTSHVLVEEKGVLHVQRPGLNEKRTVTPPSEEMVNRLNELGKEYPFCVIKRSGNHLIL